MSDTCQIKDKCQINVESDPGLIFSIQARLKNMFTIEKIVFLYCTIELKAWIEKINRQTKPGHTIELFRTPDAQGIIICMACAWAREGISPCTRARHRASAEGMQKPWFANQKQCAWVLQVTNPKQRPAGSILNTKHHFAQGAAKWKLKAAKQRLWGTLPRGHHWTHPVMCVYIYIYI